MSSTEDVDFLLLQIIRESLLRIRSAANRNDAKRCFIEADHVHNLPRLLADYDFNLLMFYWNVERVSFIKLSKGVNLGPYEEIWRELERFTKPQVE